MAKILVTESKLKQIIRESIESLLNEDGDLMWNSGQLWNGGQYRPQPDPNDQPLGPAPASTQNQINQRNQAANASLNAWNKLGTVGQIKAIQQLVGATPDGKIGPQTLGKIFMALNKKSGEINPADMGGVNWVKGKQGTYKNL